MQGKNRRVTFNDRFRYCPLNRHVRRSNRTRSAIHGHAAGALTPAYAAARPRRNRGSPCPWKASGPTDASSRWARGTPGPKGSPGVGASTTASSGRGCSAMRCDGGYRRLPTPIRSAGRRWLLPRGGRTGSILLAWTCPIRRRRFAPWWCRGGKTSWVRMCERDQPSRKTFQISLRIRLPPLWPSALRITESSHQWSFGHWNGAARFGHNCGARPRRAASANE